MSDSSTLEVEVKFLTSDLGAVRARLLETGAALKKARVYERNIRYDDLDDTLLQRGQMLRLRQDTRARVTFKGIPFGVDLSQTEARVREELEVEVSDFDTVDLIIKRLGLVARQVYEKYRETFQLGDVEIVLDEMPYGDFVELEGREADIRQTAALLGIDWDRRILINYLGLMDQLKHQFGLTFDDLTFANFEDCAVSAEDLFK
jgi:adenylate cyclase class 2